MRVRGRERRRAAGLERKRPQGTVLNGERKKRIDLGTESTKDDGTQRQCSRVGYREKKQRTNPYNRQRDGERVDWQSNVAASPYTAILLGSN